MGSKESMLGLYGRVLIAFLISFFILIFAILAGGYIPAMLLVFMFPLFIIIVFAVISVIFILSKTRFRKSINKRKINILSISIVIVTVLIALPFYSVIKSVSPTDEVLGDWNLDGGQKSLWINNTNFNRKITRLKITHDSTYNTNGYTFIDDSEKYGGRSVFHGCYEYNGASQKMTFYEESEIYAGSDWTLTLKLKIDKTVEPYRMTTYYVSDDNFQESGYFDPELFDRLTWVKRDD